MLKKSFVRKKLASIQGESPDTKRRHTAEAIAKYNTRKEAMVCILEQKR